ncbi:MAG: hypothetical protein NZ553_07410, partial [Caldilinea sp.]|nr:hypothetical protein [Caldilinea sp.]MDW8440282.1 hypothetical protein [Caldilineaceae bacterium]
MPMRSTGGQAFIAKTIKAHAVLPFVDQTLQSLTQFLLIGRRDITFEDRSLHALRSEAQQGFGHLLGDDGRP